jgi:hypothetical protein
MALTNNVVEAHGPYLSGEGLGAIARRGRLKEIAHLNTYRVSLPGIWALWESLRYGELMP